VSMQHAERPEVILAGVRAFGQLVRLPALAARRHVAGHGHMRREGLGLRRPGHSLTDGVRSLVHVGGEPGLSRIAHAYTVSAPRDPAQACKLLSKAQTRPLPTGLDAGPHVLHAVVFLVD
jgi:hypothetical protein